MRAFGVRCGLRFALRSLSLRIALRAFFASCGDCVRCVFLASFVVAGRLRKEKGEPRGENDHGSFPLVLSGQMSAAGALTIRASRAVDRVFNKIIKII